MKVSPWARRHCISVTAAENVSIIGLTMARSGGDGIAIGGDGARWPAVSVSRNVHIKGVLATENYRQGMSVTGVVGMLVEDSRFEFTGGTASLGRWSDSCTTLYISLGILYRK
jgi:hypothetical protein